MGVILTSLNLSPSSFQSWGDVYNTIIDVFNNPFKLGTVIMALVGVYINPTTKGFRD